MPGGEDQLVSSIYNTRGKFIWLSERQSSDESCLSLKPELSSVLPVLLLKDDDRLKGQYFELSATQEELPVLSLGIFAKSL